MKGRFILDKYKKFYELGNKINKAMDKIQTLDYGQYSLSGCTDEELEIYHILNNMTSWQYRINKGISIFGSGKNQSILISDLKKIDENMDKLSFKI